MVYALTPPPKTLVIGSEGFLGRHALAALRRFYPESRGTHYRGHEGIDLEHPEIPFSLEGYRYALIAAAMVNPRQCEADPERAYRCNVEGTLKLGELLLQAGVTPIFCSTDYVFDGKQALYETTDRPTPLNTYGQHKAELEERALSLDCLILRLSKIYGVQKGDGTLFDEMVRHLHAGEQIQAATDQIFAPISITDLLAGLFLLLAEGRRGIVHLVGALPESRYAMACKVASLLGKADHLVKPIAINDLDSVVRPTRVVLRPSVTSRPWAEQIKPLIEEYHENSCCSLS